MARRATNLNSAGTTVLAAAGDASNYVWLHRVVVNSGDSGTPGSVELQYADDDETIAVIDAANPSVGQVYDLDVGKRGLKVVVTGTPDVTVLYD